MAWSRINRNSNTQFFRSRARVVHVSSRIIGRKDPITGVVHVIAQDKGVTYYRPKLGG